jgi:lactoylglutathione lyase
MTVRIEHLALWTTDLERMRAFYERYFGARAGARYENPAKQFSSYFLSFGGEARVEIMHRPALPSAPEPPARGYAHLAIALASEAAVDAMAARLRADGYPVVDGPRRTGDGYYEAVALDPDGNRIEITV